MEEDKKFLPSGFEYNSEGRIFYSFPGNYRLGYHIKAGKLCRIPMNRIPVGTIRITNYGELKIMLNSEFLNPIYWALPRWFELEKNTKENTNAGTA